jgi:hypothetical protein
MAIRSTRPAPPALAIGRRDGNALFCDLPLIEGEDVAAYNDLVSRVAEAVRPRDFLEEIWVRDVVDLSWDCLRFRRLRAKFVTAAMATGLERLLQPRLGFSESSDLALQWAMRDPKSVKQADDHLKAIGQTLEAATSLTFAENIETIERMDRMVMNAEARRNAALREIERHRSTLGQAMRQASDEVVEAEFEDVAPVRGGRKDAARDHGVRDDAA